MGAKSGRAYEVTIWFVVEAERVYLGTANVNRQWVGNVQKKPKVKLLIGSETFDGTARFLTTGLSVNAPRRKCEGRTGGTGRSLSLCEFSSRAAS